MAPRTRQVNKSMDMDALNERQTSPALHSPSSSLPTLKSTPNASLPSTESVPKRRGGKPKGAQAFNAQDMTRLLQLCEEILPFGSDLWDAVAQQYSKQSQVAESLRKPRDSQFLKKQYTDLLKRAKPTGDPNQPTEVRWAMRISDAVEQKINMATLDDKSLPDNQEEEDSFNSAIESGSELEPASKRQATIDAVDVTRDFSKPIESIFQPSELSKISSPYRKLQAPTAKRIRTQKEPIATQSRQTIDQLMKGLENSDLSNITKQWERSTLIQSLEGQLDHTHMRIERLEEKIERLQEQNSTLKGENRELRMKVMLAEKFSSTVNAGNQQSLPSVFEASNHAIFEERYSGL